MLVAAVACIDDGNQRFLCGNHGRTFLGVTHGTYISIAGSHADGIGYTFTFGSGTGSGTGKSQNCTAKVHHGCFKAQTGTGTGLIEKCGQSLAVTGVCIFFGVTFNIIGQIQKLVADLNAMYKAHPALWSQDFDPAGFQWLTSDDADHNTLSFVRVGAKDEQLVVVVNFSGEAWEDYQVPLTRGGRWREILTTDDEQYGGSGIHNGEFEADAGAYHSRDWSAKLTIPALGAVFLEPEN